MGDIFPRLNEREQLASKAIDGGPKLTVEPLQHDTWL